MTFGESLYLALVLATFAGFAAMLAYTDWQFSKAKGKRPLQFMRDAKAMAMSHEVHG